MTDQPESGWAVRQQFIQARNELLDKLVPKPPRVRVLPKDDDMRRVLMHYPSRIRFPASGSVEWPLDVFTRRRLADGDVIEEKSY